MLSAKSSLHFTQPQNYSIYPIWHGEGKGILLPPCDFFIWFFSADNNVFNLKSSQLVHKDGHFFLSFKKGLITFHFSENMFLFSKWISEWAFISKMWFFFEMCFQFQNVKSFVSVVFPFSEKHNCKQKFVNKNLYSHYK